MISFFDAFLSSLLFLSLFFTPRSRVSTVYIWVSASLRKSIRTLSYRQSENGTAIPKDVTSRVSEILTASVLQFSDFKTLGTLRKTRQQRQRHQTKGLLWSVILYFFCSWTVPKDPLPLYDPLTRGFYCIPWRFAVDQLCNSHECVKRI